MNEVSIRRQGGAAIVTIPAEIMRRLDLSVGATLALDVVERTIVARPTSPGRRRRYTLAELTEGVAPEDTAAVNAELADVRSALPLGRELP
jgi:antitoxin ChpS